ncbi:PWWP domain-containing protein [Aphelenchoides avenae]|nr:PWWP domain-containing protein [Aphelenchus avenae]
MKGFPPWPATIISSSTGSNDIPAGKYGILFYGTHDTAFMKPGDLSDYMSNREAYEVPRKFKGFAEGIQEIRLAAGLNDVKAEAEAVEPSASSSSADHAMESSPNRTRKKSTRNSTADEFTHPDSIPRFRSGSRSGRWARTSTSGHLSDNKQGTDSDSKKIRSRASSISARLPKRISYSDKMDYVDLSDIDSVLQNGADPTLFSNVSLSGYLSPFEAGEHTFSGDEKSRSRKRTRSSKLLDEFLLSPGKSPRRDRSGSLSSAGCRSRMISGFSDAFEDLMESAHSIFNPHELMAAIDQLPSEESDRPITPEEPLPMPAPLKKCYACGCQCELFGLKWRCTSKLCLKWNGIHEPYKPGQAPPSTSQASAVPASAASDAKPTVSVKSEIHDLQEDVKPSTSAAFVPQEKAFATATVFTTSTPLTPSKFTPTSTVNQSPAPKTVVTDASSVEAAQAAMSLLSEKDRLGALRRCGRPRSYKVEKTPPVGENGIRNCVFCNGQVRPQMCGGNKHRWRCVDKKCRKWYGWVKSNDEIPKDLGKKGRWKDLVIRVQGQQMAQMEGQSAANYLLQNNLDSGPRPKRKYMRRKGNSPEPTPRPTSPLTLRQMSYQPSAVERRGRWWMSEKRRADVSPEREFGTSLLEVASSFQLIGNAMLSAAATKADEPGSVNGTLDLMMDSLMASMAPMLSLTAHIPGVNPDQATLQKLWSASAVHTPMF